jgi:hypothetical protein
LWREESRSQPQTSHFGGSPENGPIALQLSQGIFMVLVLDAPNHKQSLQVK